MELLEISLISTEQTIQYGILGGIAAAAAGGAKLGGLGKIFGGVASGIGQLFGIGRGRRQNKRNIQNMQLQHDLDKKMFDYQNAYNTPLMQMQRLKDAGLNPNLMYSQGTTGNASNAPYTKPLAAYQETPVDTRVFMEGANIAMQMKKTDAEIQGQKIKNMRDGGIAPHEIANEIKKGQILDKQVDKLVQETTNLKTLDKLNDFKQQFEQKVLQRAKKGIIKGDTVGNLLDVFGIDPNNPEHKTWLQGALVAWYGSQVAGNIMNGLKIPIKK
jgi:hypothetical protein